MSSEGIDYYDVQRMVEDEAAERRHGDEDARALTELRAREGLEEIDRVRDDLRALRGEVADLREGLRTLDAMRLSE